MRNVAMVTTFIVLCTVICGVNCTTNDKFLMDYCKLRGFHDVTIFDTKMLQVASQFARNGIRTSVGNGGILYSPDALHVISFQGTVSHAMLTKIGRNNGFASDKHWLLLTESNLAPSALATLSILPLYVNNDLVIAIKISNGIILLQEAFNLGQHLRVIDVGNWNGSHLDITKLNTYKYDRRGDLNGLTLRAYAVGVNKMYFQYQDDPFPRITGGFAGNIFLLLQKLLNITIDLTVLEGYAYGLYTPENDSWSGLVGSLQHKKAEISACEVSPTVERFKHLDFTHPFQIIGRRLFYRRPDKAYNAGSWLLPFATSTWLAISALLPLIVGFTYLISMRYSKRQDAFLVILYTSLLQGWPDAPRDLPRRVLLWSAYTCYFILSASYSAKLVALRTAERPQLPISNLEDILEHKEWTFGFMGAALERNFFQAAEPRSMLGRLWKERVTKNPLNLVSNVVSGLQRAFDSKYVFLGFHWACLEALRSNFSKEQACTMHINMGEYYFKGGIAFGLNKDSPLRELIDHRLMKMRETGILKRLEISSMPRVPTCSDPPFQPVTLRDVATPLILLLLGILMSVFILACEFVWKNRAKLKIIGTVSSNVHNNNKHKILPKT